MCHPKRTQRFAYRWRAYWTAAVRENGTWEVDRPQPVSFCVALLSLSFGQRCQIREGQPPKLANYVCVWSTSVAPRGDGIERQTIPIKKAETAALRFQSPGNRH